MQAASNVVFIEAQGRQGVVVLADKGITAFTAEIARRRPDLPVRLGWPARGLWSTSLAGGADVDRFLRTIARGGPDAPLVILRNRRMRTCRRSA